MGDADAQYELGRNLRIEVRHLDLIYNVNFHVWPPIQLICEIRCIE